MSGSGKTQWVYRLLSNRYQLYNGKAPKFAVLFYKEWQPLYTEMKKENLISEFVQGVPDEEEIKKIFSKYQSQGGCFAIFDDLMTEIDNTVLNCFTVFGHHLKVTVILLNQSLFLENKVYRVCSLNAHYIVLMRNRRDGASVSYLARQISPYHTKYITESFIEATKTPYSYLLFDMRQETNDILRLRSNIFNIPVSLYIENTNNKKKKK